MGNLFSKKPKVTDTDRTILTLKTQHRKLIAYQKQLDAVIVRELEVAKELLQQKKKERALLTLKRMKAQKELLKNVDIWILNVQQQLADIDTAGRQKAVYDSLKAGHKAIQDLQKEVNVEDIQKLMEESAEARAYQDEINEVLGQQLTDEDEEAVLAELESLEAEMEELPSVPSVKVPPGRQGVPEVPIAEPSDGPTALLAVKHVASMSLEGDDETSKEDESASVESVIQGMTAKDDTEGDDDVIELPSVPTSFVRAPKTGDSERKNEALKKKEQEPLPA